MGMAVSYRILFFFRLSKYLSGLAKGIYSFGKFYRDTRVRGRGMLGAHIFRRESEAVSFPNSKSA